MLFKHSKYFFIVLSPFLISTTHAVEVLSDDDLQQKEISLDSNIKVADSCQKTNKDKVACSKKIAKITDTDLVDKIINSSTAVDLDNLEALQKAINEFNENAVNLDIEATQALKSQIKNLQNIQMNPDGTLSLKIDVPPNAFDSYIYQRINKETDLEIMNITPGIRAIEVKTFK